MWVYWNEKTKNTFFNISLNNTEFSSKEFPSSGDIQFEGLYKREIGVGIQMGQTFNFHKKPLGSIVFIGLDYTWIDLNFNSYKAIDEPVEFSMPDKDPYPMPWHNEKMMFDYGMSLGPALTFYPLAPVHKDGADKLRLHFFFHVGYCVSGSLIDMGEYKGIEKIKSSKEFELGHGLFTSFGGSLTWNFVGIGFDVRNDGSLKYMATNKTFDTGKMKAKQKTTRFFIQFRF